MPKDTFFNLNEEKQENVMRTAIHEFSSQGFEKGNIGVIARNAGVAKGSMYQYFENKHELFLYCVKWAIELLMKKYSKHITVPKEETDIFDYLYESSKNTILQLREEREMAVFIQDVFLGKYKDQMDDSMKYMLEYTEQYTMELIRQGKKSGSIRNDIDDKLLCLFITGASFKIKEYIMNRARVLGEDIMDEPFEAYEKEVKTLIELIKYGMTGGAK